MPLVEVETDNHVTLITLNRPEALNALSRRLRADLADAISKAGDDPAVRAIVLTGSGTRAFSAGIDLKELAASSTLASGFAGDPSRDPVAAMATCPIPIIGAINGVAITGGFELALACDILIGSVEARFADTHVRVGILPGWGLSQRLSRLIGPSRAKEMSLTGNFIDAQTAFAWGLINRVTAPDDLVQQALRIGADIASCDPATAQRYKHLIETGYALPFTEALAYERTQAAEWASNMRKEDLADNRIRVLARGRNQTR